MRRSRIKIMATVPVRRKNIQETNKIQEDSSNQFPLSDKTVSNENNRDQDAHTGCEVEETPLFKQEPSEIDNPPVVENQSNISLASQNGTRTANEDPRIETVIQRVDASPTRSVQNFSTNNTHEASPAKSIQSRSCFMRPTPRLDGGGRIRRNSVHGSGASASESEDDSSRRSVTNVPFSRVRHDSICSMQSLKESGNVNNVAKLNVEQKRKIVVSESARKLAEARREFQVKHENQQPDRSKLTMYDLIYYNPSNNPMKVKPKVPRNKARRISTSPERLVEKDNEASEESSELPVPQVKVGPNGQLIIDEQSLVIDQFKARDNIDRSDIIIDDDVNGSGFYKKKSNKGKEWSKWETLKFYKALNTYGTDFLLMQSIFPKRTRHELKLKYKREDQYNRSLVEKALKYQEFDTESLEKELAHFEENERKEKEKIGKKPKKEVAVSAKKKRRRCRVVAKSIEINDGSTDSEKHESDNCSDTSVNTVVSTKLKKHRRKVPKKIVYSDGDDEEDEDSSTNLKHKNEEMYKVQPTRSGRIPGNNKVQKFNSIVVFDLKYYQNDNTNSEVQYDENAKVLNDTEVCNSNGDIDKNHLNGSTTELSNLCSSEVKALDCISNDLSIIHTLQAGSVIVLKEDSSKEPDRAILQVFSINKNFDVNKPNLKDCVTKVDFSIEQLQTVTDCINNGDIRTIIISKGS